jgi:hypothetical protein
MVGGGGLPDLEKVIHTFGRGGWSYSSSSRGPGAQRAPCSFAFVKQLPQMNFGLIVSFSMASFFPACRSSHICCLWFSGFVHRLSTFGNLSLIVSSLSQPFFFSRASAMSSIVWAQRTEASALPMAPLSIIIQPGQSIATVLTPVFLIASVLSLVICLEI